LLQRAGHLPSGVRLAVFGSSANGFGGPSADLDMCLVWPRGVPLPADPASVVERTAEALRAEGMTDVACRPTARIPIVSFTDPQSGLQGDVSLQNALALANTALLHAYSRVDARVRALAHVIKHWARRRRMNCAAEGTLSSYGYLLLLIQFLQQRPGAPVLPNLQALPPGWEQGGPARPLPTVETPQLADGRPANTYFYTPPGGDYSALSAAFARRNTETVGQLLLAFWHHVAHRLDTRKSVVSVRTSSPGGTLPKEYKAEADCWGQPSRLSIEDPFETWYDVAHVLKTTKDQYVRGEFHRAYTLIVQVHGNLGRGMPPEALENLLDEICKESPVPASAINSKDD